MASPANPTSATDVAAEMRVVFTEFNAHIDALDAKIAMLQRGAWYMIWALFGLLYINVFGFLYMTITGS